MYRPVVDNCQILLFSTGTIHKLHNITTYTYNTIQSLTKNYLAITTKPQNTKTNTQNKLIKTVIHMKCLCYLHKIHKHIAIIIIYVQR